MGAAGLAIVGGGPAGCAAAATARAAGMAVVLYDGGPSSWTRPVESLPPGTAALVDEIFGPGASTHTIIDFIRANVKRTSVEG